MPPLVAVALERQRLCRSRVVVVPEFEAALRSDFVGRRAEKVFVWRADFDASRRWPEGVRLCREPPYPHTGHS